MWRGRGATGPGLGDVVMACVDLVFERLPAGNEPFIPRMLQFTREP